MARTKRLFCTTSHNFPGMGKGSLLSQHCVAGVVGYCLLSEGSHVNHLGFVPPVIGIIGYNVCFPSSWLFPVNWW